MKKYFAWIDKLSSLYKVPLEKQKVVILKEEQVFACKLVLPVMPKKEVAEAVRWELPLHVPFEDGTYYFAYKSLGLSDGMEILQVYVVLKSVVQELMHFPAFALRLQLFSQKHLQNKKNVV